MMRQYHLSTQKISNFVQDILDRACYDLYPLKRGLSFFRKKKIDENFILTQGKIRLVDPALFKKGVATILRKMHELGFLSRYLTESSSIEGKVHYDLYHVHPVDIHSILAVEELEKLNRGEYQNDYPLLSSLIKEIEKPEILFLTTFLHNIGKGLEGDHSLMGT